MSLAVYKLLHVTGMFFAFAALGGLTLLAAGGVASDRARKLAGITHGIAMIVILVSGFGALARLGMSSFPLWVWIKVAVWLLLGGVLVVVRKKPEWARLLWVAIPLLGAVAAWAAFWKPV